MNKNLSNSELRDFIEKEVMTSKEVTEFLDFSRVRLMQIVKDGRITPVISGVYLRREIEAFKTNRPNPTK